MSLHQATFEMISVNWLSPQFLSLIWGLGFVTLWLGILTLLVRRGIVVKV